MTKSGCEVGWRREREERKGGREDAERCKGGGRIGRKKEKQGRLIKGGVTDLKLCVVSWYVSTQLFTWYMVVSAF